MSQLTLSAFVEQLIDKYLQEIKSVECNDETIREHYGKLLIEECINDAVNRGRYLVNGEYVEDTHYRHFSQSDLEDSQKILLRLADKFRECTSFSQVYDCIKNSHDIPGLADLYYYDTAFRIAGSRELGFTPENVYVARGALFGAEILGLSNISGNQPYIPYERFTRAFPAFKKLTPYQIESFLCVKHKDLAEFMGIPGK